MTNCESAPSILSRTGAHATGKHVIVFLSSIFILFLLLIGCSPSDDSVSFGYQPFGSNLPFFVAMDQGYFEDEGINVKPVNIISANDAANAMVIGQLVGNATIPLNVMLNIEENQPGLMKIVMVKATYADSDWSDYILVRRGSDITSMDHLRGKRVGRYPGSVQHMLVRLMLSHEGLNENDVTIVEMPPSVHLQALEAGQIDALLTYDEPALVALHEGIADILVENPIGRFVIDPMYGFPYVLSSEFIRTNPEGARQIRNALYRAVDFIEQKEAEARQIMADWSGTRPEISARVNLWAQVKAEDIDREALQRLADFFYDEGIISRHIDTSTLYYSGATK